MAQPESLLCFSENSQLLCKVISLCTSHAHSQEIYSTEFTPTLPAPLQHSSPALSAAFVNSGNARI